MGQYISTLLFSFRVWGVLDALKQTSSAANSSDRSPGLNVVLYAVMEDVCRREQWAFTLSRLMLNVRLCSQNACLFANELSPVFLLLLRNLDIGKGNVSSLEKIC